MTFQYVHTVQYLLLYVRFTGYSRRAVDVVPRKVRVDFVRTTGAARHGLRVGRAPAYGRHRRVALLPRADPRIRASASAVARHRRSASAEGRAHAEGRARPTHRPQGI